MILPCEFKERMRRFLGGQSDSFFECYEKRPSQALRVNTLKISVEEFLKRGIFALRPVPWTKDGFFYNPEERPGKHSYHEAGLYYIQEPSAMAVGVLAAPRPGERVLDLCAAPGGKTTQLAAAMEGKGLLVSNEIHPVRAKALSQNVERMGIANAVVTNEKPQALAEKFPLFFDRIVVDAPCSGEGMFRKEEQALESWSLQNIQMCAKRQRDILHTAARMLRAGGTLVYSTCTFAPEENEGTVSAFLKSHPDFSVRRTEAYEGFGAGRPEWADALPETAETFRLWPHLLEGEGHYAAALQKEGEGLCPEISEKMPPVDQSAWELYLQFARENLTRMPDGVPVLFGDQLYLLPCAFPLKGLKILRAGLHLGTCRKNRFEPSHALALFLREKDVVRSCALSCGDERVASYLKGETVRTEGENGWNLLLTDGYALGWGKLVDGVLKNHYPKGLRRT